MIRVLVCSLILALCTAPVFAQSYKTQVVAEGLDFPWAIVFLPEGGYLVSERSGALKEISREGEITEIPGVPEVLAHGQGGLMDLVLAPDFAHSRRLFFSYAHGEKRNNRLRVGSAFFDGKKLTDVQLVFENDMDKTTAHHFAGRMAFMADGTLLITVGDGLNLRDRSQSVENYFGTIVRINQDGSVPVDNPFIDQPHAKPEIWSYGHRNHQAILLAPDGTVFSNEHGPQGGDELNIIEPGKNYGWPAISHGIDYTGASITPFKEAPGMEQPILVWTPSIAPGGMALYSGDKFPEWQGDLFVAALAEMSLRRVDMQGTQVLGEELMLTELKQRMRDVRMGPDGYLYVLTDSPEPLGQVLRVLPDSGQ